MGYAPLSPSTRYRQEELGQLRDESRLLLRREHEVSVALALRGKRGEDSAAHAEIGRAPVGTLFSAFEAEGDSSKVFDIHRR